MKWISPRIRERLPCLSPPKEDFPAAPPAPLQTKLDSLRLELARLRSKNEILSQELIDLLGSRDATQRALSHGLRNFANTIQLGLGVLRQAHEADAINRALELIENSVTGVMNLLERGLEARLPGEGRVEASPISSIETSSRPSRSSSSGRILIVDDERAAREGLRDLLTEEGFLVESAADVAQAFARMPGFLPDVVITDLAMPGLGPAELIRRVRQEVMDAAVIFTTGFSQDDQVVVSLQREVGGLYVPKPLDFPWFIMTLRSVLSDLQRGRSAATAPGEVR